VRKFFRSTYYTGVTIFFLIVAGLGFTQTNTFRSFLRGMLIEGARDVLNGELRLSVLEGNLLTGFRVDSVSVVDGEGNPILFVERLEARYDPLGVLVKRISLSRVVFHRPTISVTRSTDGRWNVVDLFRPAPPDSAQAPWTINLRQALLVDGRLFVLDSLTLKARRSNPQPVQRGEFDYARIALRDLQVEAAIKIADGTTSASIRSLNFCSDQPDFALERLSGDLTLAPNEVSIQKLDVKTRRSFLRLDARMHEVNLTALKTMADLENTPLSLHLRLNALDLSELKQFVGSSLGFLQNEVRCELKVDGTFGDLEIQSLQLQTSRSTLHFSGTILNLHEPNRLELDLASLENEVDARDVRDYLPGLDVPDITKLGVVKYNLWFQGTFSRFKTHLVSESAGGAIEVEGVLDTRGPTASYEGLVKTSRANLAAFFNDKELVSSLNGMIIFKGTGVDPASMVATLRAEIDTSEFRGLRVRPSTLTMEAEGRKMRGEFLSHIGPTRFDLRSTFHFLETKDIAYRLEGTIQSLNLANVLEDRMFQSDVSFDVKVEGTGLDPDRTRSRLEIDFKPSTFGRSQFTEGKIIAELHSDDPERCSFRFRSGPFDLDIDGFFTPSTLLASLEQGITLYSQAVADRFRSLDSLRSHTGERHPRPLSVRDAEERKDKMDATFTLRVRDAYPIGIFFGRGMVGNLHVTGSLSDSPAGIAMAAEAVVGAFGYSDPTISLELAQANVKWSVRDLLFSPPGSPLNTRIEVQANQFVLDSLLLSGIATTIHWRDDSTTLKVQALIDSLARISLTGVAAYDTSSIAFRLDRLSADFSSYVFENIDTVRLRLGADGLKIENLWMRHEVEEVYADGVFDPGGESDIKVTVRSFLLNNLKSFSSLFADVRGTSLFSGMVNAEFGFKGTFADPHLTATVNASGVRYRETVFGQIISRSSYAAGVLWTNTQFRSKPDDVSARPDLLVTGSIPYHIAFQQVPLRKQEGEMNLTVQSSGFQLQFIEPFTSELKNISGTMACNMRLSGTIDAPTYEGFVNIRDARFLFVPLGIRYMVNGRLVPQGRRIAFELMTIQNVPQDRPDGKLDLVGSFTLEGLRIRDFDLSAQGQLLVMKESSRRTGQNVYGDLFGATGPGGIQWKGTPERSYVTGILYVRNANLTFPPTRQVQELRNDRIMIRVVDDANTPSSPVSVGRLSPIDDADTSGTEILTRSEILSVLSGLKNGQFDAPSDSISSTTSFLDNIVYDLIVETQGITQVRFVFNNLTNEELFADLKGRATFTKEGEQMRMVGEVELGTRSYYNSIFKKLDATGKINFTGDPFNPELDVVARYEGVYTRKGRDTTGIGPSTLAGGIPEDTRKVIVSLYITGTKEQPKVRTELAFETQDQRIVQATGDVEADALSYLVTGSFRDELTQQERGSLISTSFLGGLTSSVLSGPLTEFLRKEFGVIKSVDVLYYGGNFQESADVRLTGEIGEAVFRLGGRVFSDINNANVSVQLPMSALLGSERWRNLILEAERRVEGVEGIDQRRESRALRLLYRITF